MRLSKTLFIAFGAAALTFSPQPPNLPPPLGFTARALAKDNTAKGNPGVLANAHTRGDADTRPARRRASGRASAGDKIANTVESFGNGMVGILGNIGDAFGGKNRSTRRSRARTTGSPRSSHFSLASIEAVPLAHPNAREKALNAKLAALSSLDRDYRAYMQSTDPRMAAIRSYIDASIAHENAAAAHVAAMSARTAAEHAFAAVLVGVRPHDDYVYDKRPLSELADRLTSLHNLDRTGISDAEDVAIDLEIEALTAALNSTEARTLADAQAAAEAAAATEAALESATSDETLANALRAVADEDSIAEYGEDDYIDAEMLDWAKDLLGVGRAYGKIDQIREARAAGIPALDDDVGMSVKLQDRVEKQ